MRTMATLYIFRKIPSPFKILGAMTLREPAGMLRSVVPQEEVLGDE